MRSLQRPRIEERGLVFVIFVQIFASIVGISVDVVGDILGEAIGDTGEFVGSIVCLGLHVFVPLSY